MDVNEIGWKDEDLIDLTQGRDGSRGCCEHGNVRSDSIKYRECSDQLVTVSFSSRTLLPGVIWVRNVKVNFTLEQAMKAQRGEWRYRWGVSAPRFGRFNPQKRLGTHCTGGWVGPRDLDGCGKSRPHRDSIPGPSIS